MRVDFSRLRFIVIEDNPSMRRLMEVMLHGFGAREVLGAADGLAGLDLIRGHRPDIVVTDWEMPLLDGVAVTRRIRQGEGGIDPFLPVILVTAYAERSRVLAAREAGVNEFLVKPLSAQRLYERILGVVARPGPFVRTATYFGPGRQRFLPQAPEGIAPAPPEPRPSHQSPRVRRSAP